MGKESNTLAGKSPYKLRKRKLADGRISLFIDRSIDNGHRHEYEFLQLYLLPEDTSKAKRLNAQTLRKAESILRERTEALLNVKVDSGNDKATMHLSEWMATVYKNHEHRGARDLNGIDNARKNLIKFRASARLDEVDKQFCLDYIDWLRNSCKTHWGTAITPKTAHSYSTTLRTALNEAVRGGLIVANPWNQLDRLEKIKVPESKREFLTIEEVKRLMDTPFANEQVRQAYLFSCFCGLRISDIRKLRWNDISQSGDQWNVSVVMTKTSNPVYIPLSRQAMKWLPGNGKPTADGLVFDKLPNNSCLCCDLKSWAKSAGITKKISYHTSRHTCATMLLTLGADIYTVSKILGHRSVRTTQIYAKIIDRKKDHAISLIDNAF